MIDGWLTDATRVTADDRPGLTVATRRSRGLAGSSLRTRTATPSAWSTHWASVPGRPPSVQVFCDVEVQLGPAAPLAVLAPADLDGGVVRARRSAT